MARIPLDAEVAGRIAGVIEDFPARAPQGWQFLAPYVARYASLRLFCNWSEWIGIRPDGDLVCWDAEDRGDDGSRPLAGQVPELTALVVDSGYFPELRSLLPARPPDAFICPCRDIASFYPAGSVICSNCSGLGWSPAPEDL